MANSRLGGILGLADEKTTKPGYDLESIYADYVLYCLRIGNEVPAFEQWQKDRTAKDSGWRLNHLGW